MKKPNYQEQDKRIIGACIIITGVGVIGLIAIAFDNVNVLWTLNVLPSLIQAVNR